MGRIAQEIPEKMEEIQEMTDRQISRALSNLFIAAALGSVGLSLMFRLMGRRDVSQFIGEWAPTLMVAAVYNKLTKLQGYGTFR